MGGFGITLFVVVYMGAVALASFFILRAFIRGMKLRGALPYQPVPTVFPPIPVERTPAARLVGWVAVAWSVGHLAVIGVWLAGRWVVPHTPPTVLAAAYAGFAALLVGLGGALLLAQRPMGRVLISWGVILLVLLMFYAVIISFLLPSLEDVPAYLRRQGRIVGIVGVIHLLVDMVLGGLGQRVGRPAGWKAEKPAEEHLATEAMPGWDNPDRNR